MLKTLSIRWRPLALTAMSCVLIAGCSTGNLRDRDPTWQDWRADRPAAAVAQSRTTPPAPADSAVSRPDNSFYLPGNGKFAAPAPIADARVQQDGDIKLNFQNANLLEVVKVILGDMLQQTYVVDPRVQGAVSMQTSNALSRDDLVPTLELLLRMNDAALITDDGIYRVVPLANALAGVRAPQLGDSTLPLPPGYSVRIVPLKFVSANEMAQILEPFVTGSNQLVRVDTQRNLLVLAASGGDMDRLLETVSVFDVDRMRGMSVAMFTPDFVDAQTLGDELDKLLADPEAGLMAGLVRFIVVERLNGLMVVTPRAEYLARVRDWVKRLDRDSGSAGNRLFIYRVQNGKATEIAEILNKLFESDQQAVPAAEVAPGLSAATIGRVDAPPAESLDTPPLPRPTPAADTAAAEGLSLSNNSQVRVIADEPNNALLILANGQEYRQILSALQELDAVPLQVLIEVTIAEVTLTDKLEYGVEWFFRNGLPEGLNGRGTLELGLVDFGAAGIAGGTAGALGYSYAITKGGTVHGLLNLLDTESNISIVSSPSLLVLNNQEARIQVGDEISIKTAEQSSITTGTDVALTSTFERRETGVTLVVKPRVNPGGLVIMEVEQEVSNVPQSDVGADNPRIQQRKIQSSVAVQSGDSVLLGGLIKNNRDDSEAGIPGLRKLPLLGKLFSTTANNSDRTELLVLITPRAIANRNAALQVTEEFRRRMHRLVPVEPPAPPAPAPAATPQDGDAPQAEGRSSALTPAATAPGTSLVCERIGPFDDAAAAAAAVSSIADMPPRISDRTQTVGLGYRVLVGDFDDEQQAQAALPQLRDAGFEDALLYTAGPSRNAISLGLFARHANAERLASSAQEHGFETTLVEVNREETRFWVELRHHGENKHIDALNQAHASAQLYRTPHDCEPLAAL